MFLQGQQLTAPAQLAPIEIEFEDAESSNPPGHRRWRRQAVPLIGWLTGVYHFSFRHGPVH
jgi:hypothetical protein